MTDIIHNQVLRNYLITGSTTVSTPEILVSPGDLVVATIKVFTVTLGAATAWSLTPVWQLAPIQHSGFNFNTVFNATPWPWFTLDLTTAFPNAGTATTTNWPVLSGTGAYTANTSAAVRSIVAQGEYCLIRLQLTSGYTGVGTSMAVDLAFDQTLSN